ncbi:MAG: lasso peptide biosynthesis PqqD family chaperone [Actinomycetota bacterium]|nr:lasso peptide biosynthesis PqqD family chaperone [Actinomycetota bacterium]
MTFSLAPHVTTTRTEHGVVLLDERTGRYWQMNGTGALVLRSLIDGKTLESVVADLRDRYPAASEQAGRDVETLLDALRTAKLTLS